MKKEMAFDIMVTTEQTMKKAVAEYFSVTDISNLT